MLLSDVVWRALCTETQQQHLFLILAVLPFFLIVSTVSQSPSSYPVRFQRSNDVDLYGPRASLEVPIGLS